LRVETKLESLDILCRDEEFYELAQLELAFVVDLSALYSITFGGGAIVSTIGVAFLVSQYKLPQSVNSIALGDTTLMTCVMSQMKAIIKDWNTK
jgi:hypothetical protein